MEYPKRIFFTGAPGSKWSAIAQVLEDMQRMNTTDRTPEREYNHNQYSGHKGAYFGTGMEFDANCSFTDQAFEDPDAGCMLIKSHEWAEELRGIQLYQKEDWIMLIYRPDLTCHEWWHQAGGFTIDYPNYDYYENSSRMLYKIRQQNDAMLEFAFDNNLRWEKFDTKWISTNFRQAVGNVPEFKDVLVTMYKP